VNSTKWPITKKGDTTCQVLLGVKVQVAGRAAVRAADPVKEEAVVEVSAAALGDFASARPAAKRPRTNREYLVSR
jgi:hypothetical protein